MHNIEIKANCSKPELLHEKLIELGADFIGTDHQIDTYFNVPDGRLKLREGNIENALIGYSRPDQPDAKRSEFNLYHSSDPYKLKSILTTSLGVLTTVDKKRRIYFIRNVKFHIDEVKGLGSFMEIEVTNMDGTHDTEVMSKECRKYMDLLSIDESDLVSGSYSDMFLQRDKPEEAE